MRIYSIDQLQGEDIAAISGRLREMDLQSGLEGIYWLPVPPRMLTPAQTEHAEHCGPYCLALEVMEDSVHLELLVRGMGRISCACLSFASEELRNHMIVYLEEMLTELGITF